MVWRVRGSQWYDVGSEGDGKMKGQGCITSSRPLLPAG